LKDRKTPKSKNLLFGGAGFSTNPNQTPMLRNKSELEKRWLFNCLSARVMQKRINLINIYKHGGDASGRQEAIL
jgi:hypothetical protein